ncbi:MAG: hypothetical protein H0U73_02215 [Tatlockia sp.]|nr:hypothetical protein [Tatlockia sp.]
MFSRNSYFKIPVDIIISPGQALLILMDKYKDHPELLSELKSLYLVGVEDQESATRIQQLFNDDALVNYRISFKPKIISEDPTRRFFETYLSYLTLYSSIKDIDEEKLNFTLNEIFSLLLPGQQNGVLKYFHEKKPAQANNPTLEFQDTMFKIDSHKSFSFFCDSDKIKLNLLNLLAYTSMFLSQNEEMDLPLNVFSEGYYGRKNRGRIEKPRREQTAVRSCGLGLMKSYMPLPQCDFLYNEEISTYYRIADRNTFIKNSKWAIDNFSKLVHPFSASISGTVLALIRVLAHFHQADQLQFNDADEFKTLYKCCISLLLFSSGGHSLHEFVAPINIAKIQDYFQLMDGFSDINLKSLFLDGNEMAFDLAINKTINYNKLILNKKFVNSDINNQVSMDSTFLVNKLEIIEKLSKIKVQFFQKMAKINFLSDVVNDIGNLICSANAKISQNDCNSDSIIEDIFAELQREMHEKIKSETQDIMKIFAIKNLSSHKLLSQEHEFISNFVNELSSYNHLDPETSNTSPNI